MKTAFFDTKLYDRESFETANADERYGFDIRFFEARLTAESAPMAADCDCVCAFVNDDLSAETLERLHACGVKLIALRCAGFNNVDLPAAVGMLDVVRVPDYSPYAVAEYTLAMLLCLNRKIHRAYCRIREGNFSINGLQGFDLHGKTVGVAGTGKIGRTFIRLLSGFGVKVLAYDPFPGTEESAFEYTDFESLLTHSDIISLHCPLTPENIHLFARPQFAKMKRGAMLINTSRGKLVHSADLIDALKSGQLGGAALDVYEEETGYFFEDRSNAAIRDDVLARLTTFPNVLITSHQAFFTREALANIAQTTLENIRLYFTAGEMPNGICIHCSGGKCPDCRKVRRVK